MGCPISTWAHHYTKKETGNCAPESWNGLEPYEFFIRPVGDNESDDNKLPSTIKVTDRPETWTSDTFGGLWATHLTVIICHRVSRDDGRQASYEWWTQVVMKHVYYEAVMHQEWD